MAPGKVRRRLRKKFYYLPLTRVMVLFLYYFEFFIFLVLSIMCE